MAGGHGELAIAPQFYTLQLLLAFYHKLIYHYWKTQHHTFECIDNQKAQRITVHMHPKLILLVVVGGVTFVVTRSKSRHAKQRNKKQQPSSTRVASHAGSPQQQDVVADCAQPSTSGDTQTVIISSATTSLITTILVLAARDHALVMQHVRTALPHLYNLPHAKLHKLDNVLIACLLLVASALLAVMAAQVCSAFQQVLISQQRTATIPTQPPHRQAYRTYLNYAEQ